MNINPAISDYLNGVLRNWEATRGQFPKNTFPENQWPIPSFGDPTSALVMTVGVNPSMWEFTPASRWENVETEADLSPVTSKPASRGRIKTGHFEVANT